jgi:hypothetical protein
MEYGGTSHNRTVYASPPVGGSGYGFAIPGLATQALIWAAKRRKQPERYVQYA